MKSAIIVLMSSIILSSTNLSTNVAGDDKNLNAKDQVGRFQLQIIKNGDEHILYRIDTITGSVFVFDPIPKTIISDENIEKVAKDPSWARQLRKEGHIVLENPYWKKLPENLENVHIKLKN